MLDFLSECLSLQIAVRVTPVATSCKAPSHAVGGAEHATDARVRESSFLHPEPVQPKVWPLSPYCRQDIYDGTRIALPLADASDTDPTPRR